MATINAIDEKLKNKVVPKVVPGADAVEKPTVPANPNSSQYNNSLDYGTQIKTAIGAGASASEVQALLTQRVNKAQGTPGLQQYAYDDIYKSATEYINKPTMSSITSEATAQADADKEALIANMDNALANQMRSIENNLTLSVAEQEQAKLVAQSDYEANVKQLEQDTYQASEFNKATSAMRGIGDSAQSSALQQGTLSRSSQAKLATTEKRNSTLASIANRIATLRGIAANDKVAAQANRDYGIAAGVAGISSQLAGTLTGLKADEYSFNRSNDASIVAADKSYSREQESADVAWARELESKGIDQAFAKEMQDLGFEQDITKMGIAQEYAKELENIGYSHSAALQAASFSNQLSLLKTSAEIERAQSTWEYNTAIDREYRKYTPGTKEANIYQNVRAAKTADAKAEALVELGALNTPEAKAIKKDLYEQETANMVERNKAIAKANSEEAVKSNDATVTAQAAAAQVKYSDMINSIMLDTKLGNLAKIDSLNEVSGMLTNDSSFQGTAKSKELIEQLNKSVTEYIKLGMSDYSNTVKGAIALGIANTSKEDIFKNFGVTGLLLTKYNYGDILQKKAAGKELSAVEKAFAWMYGKTNFYD